jgi:hypothetical protein
MPEEVVVTITNKMTRTEPPMSSLEYVVRNNLSEPIWLVDDGWLVWRKTGRQIELSFARAPMRPGVQVFGYFPPAVVKVLPGEGISRGYELLWPYSLDRTWNVERQAAPEPGEYSVSVRVGYGLTPAPDNPVLGESVDAPVLRWQREVVSQPVRFNVPLYPFE